MADDEQKVLDALKDAAKPMRPGEIAEATGLDSKEVSKILKNLKSADAVCSPKRCFYAHADYEKTSE
ncbi:MarR family transcriptional regulator [Methanolobus mangrovi]|uniref:MarR family transcriptional regulator n=1 Tax=Methanolobus mangrovi TaxID=3072977 RepID=A0AA51UIQ7_9EURY|nr:helix-turn-helix domain-containing protein [Methanolobus mangrovi]WMW22867.1 MarR family transcriptional regulator [Methanolobus mangrovi]